MGHFRGRPAPRPRRPAGARRPRARAARRRADRAAAARDAAAVVAHAGPRPGIARNTVADAYGQLVAEGWLTARQGSGTRVADRAAAVEAASAPAAAAEARRLRYDLRPGSPDLSSFPRPGWLAAARRALAAAPHEALGYSDPRGRPELRARPRRLPRPGPRRPRDARSSRRLLGLHPGAAPAVPGAACARRGDPGGGGVRPAEPPPPRHGQRARPCGRLPSTATARRSASSATPARCC